MAITEKQRHEFFKQAEEVFGPDGAETLMNMLPPVGWADVATKHDLDDKLGRLAAEFRGELRGEVQSLRADVERGLRQQLVTFLSANAVLLGAFTAITQALG